MATFSEEPTYVYTEMKQHKTNVISFENGKEARYSKGSFVREFTLEFRSLNGTDKDTIVDFYIAREGRSETFDWENPIDSTTYTVRFSDDALSIENVDYDIFDILVNFVEVL